MNDAQRLRLCRFLKKVGTILDTPILQDGRIPIVFKPNAPASPLDIVGAVRERLGVEVNAWRARRHPSAIVVA